MTSLGQFQWEIKKLFVDIFQAKGKKRKNGKKRKEKERNEKRQGK